MLINLKTKLLSRRALLKFSTLSQHQMHQYLVKGCLRRLLLEKQLLKSLKSQHLEIQGCHNRQSIKILNQEVNWRHDRSNRLSHTQNSLRKEKGSLVKMSFLVVRYIHLIIAKILQSVNIIEKSMQKKFKKNQVSLKRSRKVFIL